MSIIGRKTLKSVRARSRKIDLFFLRLLQTFLICCGIFVFVAWLSYRPAFVLNTIVIEGTHAIDPEEIKVVAHDALSWKFFSRLRRDNMLFYPTRRVLALIRATDSRVRDIHLTFDSRHVVHLFVEEYTPDLLYCPQVSDTSSDASSTRIMNFSGCYLADMGGYVYAPSPEYSGYPFLVIIASSTDVLPLPPVSPVGTFVLPQEEYIPLRKFVELLKKIKVIPRTVTLLGNHDFRIRTQLPWDIIWSTEKDPEESAQNLKLALPTILDTDPVKADFRVIDLRFGNKIFYK